MLLFVLHLLGDLLEIGSRSCELRRPSVLQPDFQGPPRGLFLRASSAPQTLCIGQVLHANRTTRTQPSRLVSPQQNQSGAAIKRDMPLEPWPRNFQRVGPSRASNLVLGEITEYPHEQIGRAH